MLQDVNRLRKFERIELQQRSESRVGPQYRHVLAVSKNLFVFAFCGFYHHEFDVENIELPEKFVNRVALARTRRARDEHVHGQAVPVQKHPIFGYRAHVENVPEVEGVFGLGLAIRRDLPAELRVFDDGQSGDGTARKPHVQRQLVSADESTGGDRKIPDRAGVDEHRVDEVCEVLVQTLCLSLIRPPAP